MRTFFVILLSATVFQSVFCQEQQTEDLPPYGIVLSGGGALGFAHIGALMALEEAGIDIAMVSGASMGSIVGAMYAYGYSPQEMIAIIEKEKLYKKSKIFNFHLFNRNGLSNHKKVKKILDCIFPIDSFDSLKRFFALSMTNFAELETEYACSGDRLKEKIRASAAIPSVFEPVVIDGVVYVDGAILNNLPIEPIKGKCQKIIMVDVNAVSQKVVNSGKIKIGYRAGMGMLKQMNAGRIAQADYYIGLENLEQYHPFDFKKYKAIIQIGYEGTKQYLKEHTEDAFGQMLDATQLSQYPLFTSFAMVDTLPAEKVLRLSFKRKLPADFNEKIVKYNYLQELHLKNMRLKNVPSAVWSLSNLTVLDLSNNKLTALSDSLGELIYLERLIINRNNIATLPSQISQLLHLRYIDMFSTQIVDFPEEIRLLENSLKEIDMRIILMNDADKLRLQSYLPKTKFLFSNSCNCKY